jgi:hypothetical protein
MNLNLQEIVSLYHELNGFVRKDGDQEIVVLDGILKHKMSLKLKVYLQRLNKVLAEELKIYEEARKELFEKYGTQKGEDFLIEGDNLVSFNKEHNDILKADKTIDVSTLWSTDFSLDSLASIETDEHYPVLFKLIDK